jgi:hypothetical protein
MLTLDPVANTLKISGGNTISLADYKDDTDTDKQDLHLASSIGINRTISIDRGGSATFNVADNDNDPTNEIQKLSYDPASEVLSIDGAPSVAITETQTIKEVLLKGNDANGQTISNVGDPVASKDVTNKNYVDNAAAAINSRISTNYAFKTTFAFSTLLALTQITVPFATVDQFDDFDVVKSTGFTAPVDGIYTLVLDGTSTGLLTSAAVSLSYAGNKYPVTISGNGQYNSTFMFKLNAGQVVTVVVNGLGLNSGVTGSFYGYKLL